MFSSDYLIRKPNSSVCGNIISKGTLGFFFFLSQLKTAEPSVLFAKAYIYLIGLPNPETLSMVSNPQESQIE